MSVILHHGDYRKKLKHVAADLIFTSPPYNIGSGGPRKDGFRRQGKYDPKSFGGITGYPDHLPEREYQKQQVDFLEWATDHLKPDGVLVYNHKPRRNGHVIHPCEWMLKARGLVLMEEVVWDRGSTHNHCSQMLWQQTERLYVFKRPNARYRFNQLKAKLPDGYRSDVWKITRPHKNNGHNAPFPIELATAVILAWSQPDELVCDPYAGSGTVALAAQQLGRNFEGAELIKTYYRKATERIAA